MPHLNGHSNGHSVNGHGGTGGTAPLATTDHAHERGDARMTAMALRKGWLTPESADDALPRMVYDRAVKAWKEGNDRSLATFAEILRRMKADNASSAIALDKIERLDGGQDTDRATIRVRFVDEQANRLAQLHGD